MSSGCFNLNLTSCAGAPVVDAGVTPEPPEEPGLEGDPDADAGLDTVAQTSADTRLWAALERGEIDEKTLALYHVLSWVAPSHLPPAFARSDVEPPASPQLFRQAMQSIASYTPEQQALLTAIMVDPSDPRFLSFAMGFGSPGCVEAVKRGAFATGTPITTRHFNLEVYVGVPIADPDPQAAADQLRAQIAAHLQDPVTTTGLVAGTTTFGEYLDRVYDKYVELGFPAPRGGARATIRVFDCDGFQEVAYADLNKNEVTVSRGLGFLDPQLSKVVLPHEIFHLFEVEAPDHPNKHYWWPFEAMATAMEHLIAPEVMRWSGIPAPGSLAAMRSWWTPMNRSFLCPEEPFHSVNHNVCKQAAAPSADFPGRSRSLYPGSYSKFVYFLWLAKRSGLGALRSFWVGYAGASGDPRGEILDSALSDFQLALLGDVPPEQSFEPRDRNRFVERGAGLDLPVRSRARYTFAAEAPFLQRGWGHAADVVQGSAAAPTELVGETFPLQPGATWRLFVEEPAPPAELTPTASTVVWDTNGSPKVRAHPVDGAAQGTPRFVPLPLVDLTTTDTWFLLAPDHRRTVMVFTNPVMASPLTARFGVTSAPECFRRCVGWLRPQVAPCCPTECEGQDADCVRNCQDDGDMHTDRANSMCLELCNVDDTPWSIRLMGTGYDSYAQALCATTLVPACRSAPAGLVPFTGQPMNCRQIANKE